MKYCEIELDALQADPDNIRKTGDKALAELKASILAHGLLQNLLVKEVCGQPVVVAGNRRLLALKALLDEGNLPDALRRVPCQVIAPGMAVETALAENTQRVAMHPADEFEAFKMLADQGRSAEEIAQRFGCSEKKVQQRLKLARVHPELLTQYREGKMKLEVLEAFTLTDDTERQVQLWNGLHQWDRNSAFTVKRSLSEQLLKGDDKLVEFVGLEVYRQAGGAVSEDLFGEEVYLENVQLLQRLAGEKLDEARQQVLGEGWGWVEVDFERMPWDELNKMGRLKAEETEKTAEIDAELEALEREETANDERWDEVDEGDDPANEECRSIDQDIMRRRSALEKQRDASLFYDPAKKKMAGCFLWVTHDGTLGREDGLLLAADMPKGTKPLGKNSGEGEEKGEETVVDLPASLQAALADQRLAVMQLALALSPDVARDLLGFTLVKRCFFAGYTPHLPDLRVTTHRTGHDGMEAEKKREEILRGLEKEADWYDEEASEAEQFQAYRQLPPEWKYHMQAHCVAMTVYPSLLKEGSATELALTLSGASVENHWRPTAENFLKKLTREQLIALGTELMGEDWREDHHRNKKAALVQVLEEAFADPDEAATGSEMASRIAGWLPEGMGFATASTPDEVKEAA